MQVLARLSRCSWCCQIGSAVIVHLRVILRNILPSHVFSSCVSIKHLIKSSAYTHMVACIHLTKYQYLWIWEIKRHIINHVWVTANYNQYWCFARDWNMCYWLFLDWKRKNQSGGWQSITKFAMHQIFKIFDLDLSPLFVLAIRGHCHVTVSFWDAPQSDNTVSCQNCQLWCTCYVDWKAYLWFCHCRVHVFLSSPLGACYV